MWILPVLLLALAQEQPEVTFGTTVVSSSGFEGKIYFIKKYPKEMPKLEKMKPKGSIYADALNVPPQDFAKGFPGITDRNEWFAIDYGGRFWVETEGEYRFRLLSDDGARLYLDGQLVIDNDGMHPAEEMSGSAVLSRGIHTIRVPYFQGPRFAVALVLQVARPGRDFQVFRMSEFQPAEDTADLVTGVVRSVKPGIRVKTDN
ncbi:PA14 domain-containing protein [Bryobacter aggregatus]|uniref:PA14 domain-containing protein n=1 Tax=Bryobacter aggregatus TaxID=360054 RepID=UPI0012BA7FF9|nr:PA14 domain-containing protein [Bryobacter aggregatus]